MAKFTNFDSTDFEQDTNSEKYNDTEFDEYVECPECGKLLKKEFAKQYCSSCGAVLPKMADCKEENVGQGGRQSPKPKKHSMVFNKIYGIFLLVSAIFGIISFIDNALIYDNRNIFSEVGKILCIAFFTATSILLLQEKRLGFIFALALNITNIVVSSLLFFVFLYIFMISLGISGVLGIISIAIMLGSIGNIVISPFIIWYYKKRIGKITENIS